MIETTDKDGRTYKKCFYPDRTDAVICKGKINRPHKVRINVSLRTGRSKFGNQVIVQGIIKGNLETYKSKSPFEHLEIYLPLNYETLVFFEEITQEIREEVKR